MSNSRCIEEKYYQRKKRWSYCKNKIACLIDIGRSATNLGIDISLSKIGDSTISINVGIGAPQIEKEANFEDRAWQKRF